MALEGVRWVLGILQNASTPRTWCGPQIGGSACLIFKGNQSLSSLARRHHLVLCQENVTALASALDMSLQLVATFTS